MDLALSLALRAGLIVYCLVVPGWAILRATGFASESMLDRILACLAAGAAVTGLAVTTLLLAGIYYRPLLGCLMLVALAYPIWSHLRAAPAAIVRTSSEALPAVSAIDRAVIVAALGFLAVYLVDAWTSPITWWDGLASWGKWAADWGRRTSSSHYVVGGYPQLVPRLASVMYKMTGAHSDVLPLDFFALHGVYVLFAVWFVVAAVRLAQVLDMPAWPTILVALGSTQFREHVAAGTVDVLVAALLTTLMALYFSLRRGAWRARHESVVLGGAAAALLMTKWTGGVGLLLLLLFDRDSRRIRAARPERAALTSRTARRAVAIAAIASVPFLIEQGISEARLGHWRPDPFEVNISVRQMPTLLQTDANVVYRGGNTGVRAGLVQLRFWNSYEIPASLRLVFTSFMLACLASAATTWFGWVALPPIFGYLAIWLFWSSYDQRNIFGILPMLSLCASFGAARLWRTPPSALWKNAVALLAGLFLLLAEGGLLKDAQERIATLSRGDHALAARLHAMRGSIPDKVAFFYPQLDHDYRFISALADRTQAAHVLVTSPLFRFFPRGAHALSLWPYDQVQAGDVFAGHDWHLPPDDPRWVLLAHGPSHRIWLRVSGVRPVVARSETIAGGGSRVLYDVGRADLGEEGLLVWRASLKGDTGTGAAIYVTDGTTLDPSLVSTVCEAPGPRVPDYRCSGIVALTGDALRSYRDGQLAVGVSTEVPPDAVAVTVARPLPPPDGPR